MEAGGREGKAGEGREERRDEKRNKLLKVRGRGIKIPFSLISSYSPASHAVPPPHSYYLILHLPFYVIY